MKNLICLSILLALVGCAAVDDAIIPPKFSPPISSYSYGDLAIVNTNGSVYDGFFDGKMVKIVGAVDGKLTCECSHGDHVDTLYLTPADLIKEPRSR
jgi:hypothetical protein